MYRNRNVRVLLQVLKKTFCSKKLQHHTPQALMCLFCELLSTRFCQGKISRISKADIYEAARRFNDAIFISVMHDDGKFIWACENIALKTLRSLYPNK
jgi:hypothetical protein